MRSLSLVSELTQDSIVGTIDNKPRNIKDTVQKISALLDLQDNWDGYSALAPKKEAFVGSVQLAYELLNENTPNPDVFPVPNGNIQFEWSSYGLEIEVEICSNRKYFVSFEDLSTSIYWEKELTYDLSDLSDIVTELGIRSLNKNNLKIVS